MLAPGISSFAFALSLVSSGDFHHAGSKSNVDFSECEVVSVREAVRRYFFTFGAPSKKWVIGKFKICAI
jgi:hypothetical protein